MENLQDALEILSELKEDTTLPKNVRTSIETIIKVLKEEEKELSLRIDRAMQELEEISSDINLDQFARGQILAVVSLLEGAL